MEAKQIGILTFSLFAMMDLEESTFDAKKFEISLLGQRLKMWSILPDSHNLHGLWTKSPQQATFQWFASLQQLLLIEQQWVKRLRYHPDKGFFHARDEANNRYLMLESNLPSHIPGRTDTLTETFRQFDQKFEARWFGSWLMDPIWTTPIPDGHSMTTKKHPLFEAMEGDHTTGKRVKMAGKKHNSPDFINAYPPMEMVVSIPRNKSATTTMLNRFQVPIPFPRLPSENGTSQTICLNSAFVSPHNCCAMRLCGDKKSIPRLGRLHLDLSKEPWKSKPEQYWAPLVQFLQHDTVHQHVRPTRALKMLTPSTRWH
jgi:hypothetical protein